MDLMHLLRNQSPPDDTGGDLDLINRDISLLEQAMEDESKDTSIPGLDEKLDTKDDEVPEKVDEEEIRKELAEVDDKFETYSPVSFKTITDKYPNFFKEFRDFREIIGRHAEFTKIFPTVDDAADAYERAGEFDRIEDDIASGNISNILDTIREASVQNFEDVIGKVLPYVATKDTQLYRKITAPVIDQLIKAIYQSGLSSKNEDLQNTALQASLWAFGSEDYATGKLAVQSGTRSKPDPDREKFEREKEQYLDGKRHDAELSVSAFIEKKVRAKIDEGLKNLPEGFIKRKIADDVWELVQDNLEQDSRHMKTMTAMWAKARRSSYSDEFKSRIITAVLSRTLSMIPGLRVKVVSEALGKPTQSKPERIRIKADDPNLEAPPRETSTIRGLDFKKIDRTKTSDLDILNAVGGDSNAKIHLKGK